MDEDYEAFDSDIVMHINSVFNILNQLGVGPDDVFVITGPDQMWSSFITGNNIVMVKSFMFLKVKMMFDPPSGSVYNSFESTMKELEWRLNWEHELELDEE